MNRDGHVCVDPEGRECVGGRLYNNERRIARPVCPCPCHNTRKGKGL